MWTPAELSRVFGIRANEEVSTGRNPYNAAVERVAALHAFRFVSSTKKIHENVAFNTSIIIYLGPYFFS
jgi:hypothetical protein